MAVLVPIVAGVLANEAAKKEAKQQEEIGRIEADDRRRAARKLTAAQQVGFALGGVDTQVGSPLDVLGDTVSELELDALRARFARQSQAFSTRQGGAFSVIQGVQGTIGTVLGTVTSGLTPARRTPAAAPAPRAQSNSGGIRF